MMEFTQANFNWLLLLTLLFVIGTTILIAINHNRADGLKLAYRMFNPDKTAEMRSKNLAIYCGVIASFAATLLVVLGSFTHPDTVQYWYLWGIASIGFVGGGMIQLSGGVIALGSLSNDARESLFTFKECEQAHENHKSRIKKGGSGFILLGVGAVFSAIFAVSIVRGIVSSLY